MHTQNTEQTSFAPNTTKNKTSHKPTPVVGYQDFGTTCWSYVQEESGCPKMSVPTYTS